MTDDDAPALPSEPEPAARAAAQQQALEQALRIRDLEAAVEALRSERAELIEHQRVLRAHAGVEGAAREIKSKLQARVRAVRAPVPPPVPALSLAAFPVECSSAVPDWSPAIDIAGDVRPGFSAEPPAAVSWILDVPAGSVLRGAVALRPGAWSMNSGGVECVVEVAPSVPDAVAVSHLQVVDPGARVADRGWIDWHLPVPGAGRYRIAIRVQLAGGAAPDYAWAVVGDLRLEVPGLPARDASSGGPMGARHRAAKVRSRLRSMAADRASDQRHAWRHAGRAAMPGARPRITLLLPVHDPEPGLLERTLASVHAQSTDDWALSIVDDGSSDPLVRDCLTRAAEDPRVTVQRHETAQGISAATNAALRVARTEFVATLDHDDLLAPDALEAVGALLAERPGTDVVYSDNDLLAGNRRFSAALKPDWSPDLLRALMYTLHFGVYRRTLVEGVGGWRSAFDGAQDHDLVLRLSERTSHIRHLPRILYHWRAHAGSAALGELAKPLAYDRGREAIAEHLGRIGSTAEVERLPQAGRYRVRHPRVRPVVVLVPVRGDAADAGLADCVGGLLAVLRATDQVHLIAAGGPEGARAAQAAAARAADDRAVVVPAPAAADPLAAAVGHAATMADDRTVIILERPMQIGSGGAIDELAGHVEAGAWAAGGIVSHEQRVVAGGVAFPQGLPVPLHPDASLGAADPHPALTMVTNRLAVRGVVAFDPQAVRSSALARGGSLALAAVSLAAAEAGHRVVWSPHATFAVDRPAADALLAWSVGDALALDRGRRTDPFWNPQLWPDRGDATVPEAVHENPLLDVVDA